MYYDPNGGTGGASNDEGLFGYAGRTANPATTVDTTVGSAPIRTGYTFAGWKAAETGIEYSPADALQ